MTPAARAAAAIAVLDRILGGTPAEQALINWGRASRFAGSGDRHAVRDLVYDALRCKRSFAALGGGMTGRGLVLGGLRSQGIDAETLFTGEGHAPAALTPAEAGLVPEGAEALDVPDWLLPRLQAALGPDTDATLLALRRRAPVYLRMNTRRATAADILTSLAADGIAARLMSDVSNALQVMEGARKIQTSAAYQSGLVELQDLSSQAVVQALPLQDGMKVLDHCAGGGGKTLAMAARADLRLFAHDAEPRRMADLTERAKRAGIAVSIVENPEKTAPYDVILTDVPCSGSGSWRRDPQGKWALTEARLDELIRLQSSILTRVAPMVAKGGVLAYATCSLLRDENEDRISQFLAEHPGWTLTHQQRFSPLQGGDGFFLARLMHD
jgi:16S rRNA (cytosine967-C5)-methyltransferase